MNALASLSAQEVARLLDLSPHPEGGYYKETFRDSNTIDGRRGVSTAIYYLLPEGQVSAWHRVDAVEIWHFYAGAPLALMISPDGAAATTIRLGPDLGAGERPQGVVPPNAWQAAKSLGKWTLVGCTVAPAFEFERFELAPPGFAPRV